MDTDLFSPVNTSPKPFVFVLMPFADKFKNVYEIGIKGAANEAGAYAERLDEQYFIEGMLARIRNQISKADIIVADTTDKNPNVFYEIGYAHALNKTVILLASDPEEIPFDLKHYPHVIYEGDSGYLLKKLKPVIEWAISESGSSKQEFEIPTPSIQVFDKRVSLSQDEEVTLTYPLNGARYRWITIEVSFENKGESESIGSQHVYLSHEPSQTIHITGESDWSRVGQLAEADYDGWTKYMLNGGVDVLPALATTRAFPFTLKPSAWGEISNGKLRGCIQLHYRHCGRMTYGLIVDLLD